jgi:hypothetical protein
MEYLGALGGFGVLIFLFILIVLGIILPISVYAAQKWAYRCFVELELVKKAQHNCFLELQQLNVKIPYPRVSAAPEETLP